jgi:FAD/FMN-containing dehydrogenase
MTLKERVGSLIEGDAYDDAETLKKYSRDTSILERTPSLVVFPKHAADVAALTKFVREEREAGRQVTLTARSAGTDMTGGPLTDSIVMVFTKYMNHVGKITPGSATTQPGVYYRDFEKETLAKGGAILPSYPASRELCAMGGIVNNNSGGELTLRYGKTENYIEKLEVVLSDGSQATLKPLTLAEVALKEREPSLEASIYRNTRKLIEENRDEIERARPTVSKNSAGYALWNVFDEKAGTFDLSRLVCGAQGTLAMLTEATLRLVKPKEHKAMLVIFLSDFEILPEIVKRVLAEKPESFESYDDKTFGLAIKFMPQMLSQMGLFQAIKLGISFLPEVFMALTGGIPKLILMAEFAEDTQDEAIDKARATQAALQGLAVSTKIAKNKSETAKYWKVRRESFALLRKNVKGLYAAPFIDDFSVHPKDYPTFLPELDKLVRGHSFIYTIAGHVGDGNFHIIPLTDMSKPEARQEILDLMPKVFSLVQKYGGSITGEHNDGIIRTPYLSYQFSPKMLELFAEVKKIWDPAGVFNPGKKVGGTIADIERDMITRI